MEKGNENEYLQILGRKKAKRRRSGEKTIRKRQGGLRNPIPGGS